MTFCLYDKKRQPDAGDLHHVGVLFTTGATVPLSASPAPGSPQALAPGSSAHASRSDARHVREYDRAYVPTVLDQPILDGVWAR